jgi:hypothetical protein
MSIKTIAPKIALLAGVVAGSLAAVGPRADAAVAAAGRPCPRSQLNKRVLSDYTDDLLQCVRRGSRYVWVVVPRIVVTPTAPPPTAPPASTTPPPPAGVTQLFKTDFYDINQFPDIINANGSAKVQDEELRVNSTSGLFGVTLSPSRFRFTEASATFTLRSNARNFSNFFVSCYESANDGIVVYLQGLSNTVLVARLKGGTIQERVEVPIPLGSLPAASSLKFVLSCTGAPGRQGTVELKADDKLVVRAAITMPDPGGVNFYLPAPQSISMDDLVIFGKQA